MLHLDILVVEKSDRSPSARITVPRVAFQIPCNPHISTCPIGRTVSDFFALINDTSITPGNSAVRIGYYSDLSKTSRDLIRIESFSLRGEYFVSVRTKRPLTFTSGELYAGNQFPAQLQVYTNLVKRRRDVLQVFMTLYDGDMEGVLKTPASVKCPYNIRGCLLTLTYDVRGQSDFSADFVRQIFFSTF